MRNWIRLKELERELAKAEKQHRIFQQSEKYKKFSRKGDGYILK